MALAILLGGIFGLLVAGGVLAVGTIRQGRRDQDDINHAFAEARGEKHDPVIGPAPWSSIDMEALVEEGVAVDRSDPYATLTGSNAFVSWSHSNEASDADDIASFDDQPATHLTHEADETFVAEPDETFIAEPDETFIAEPDETFIAEPDDAFVAKPEETFAPEPDDTFVAKPDKMFIAEPDETFVAEPAPMFDPEPAPRLEPEPVASGAAPARIQDDGPVVWRAPAESQVIIFVVALRAIADAVEATLTSGGATQWDGLEDALAQVRSTYERGNGNVRRSSIDVGGHDRPATDGSSSRIIREGRSAPRRTGPSRRHNGPKPITWRAAGR
jgi:Cornifin (SPRR) family